MSLALLTLAISLTSNTASAIIGGNHYKQNNDVYYGKEVTHPMGDASLDQYLALFETMSKNQINLSMSYKVWPKEALKPYLFREDYYKEITQSTVSLYSSRQEDDFPHIVTFWNKQPEMHTNIVNGQAFISKEFEDRSIKYGYDEITKLRNQFLDEGYVITKGVKLSELDTTKIGINRAQLSEEENNQLIEIQMKAEATNGANPRIQDTQFLTISLTPIVTDGKLGFSNVAVFFSEVRAAH